jgi:hypothetical protein
MSSTKSKKIPNRPKPNWFQSLIEKRKINRQLNSDNLQVQKPDLTNQPDQNRPIASRISHNKSRYKETATMRVLKPAKDSDLQSYLHSPKSSPSKTMQVVSGFPIISKILANLSFSDKLKGVNYTLLRFKVFSIFNWIIAIILLVGMVGSFVYISFFDQYFLVTDYQISFGPNSYLDQQELETILKRFATNKTGGICQKINTGFKR